MVVPARQWSQDPSRGDVDALPLLPPPLLLLGGGHRVPLDFWHDFDGQKAKAKVQTCTPPTTRQRGGTAISTHPHRPRGLPSQRWRMKRRKRQPLHRQCRRKVYHVQPDVRRKQQRRKRRRGRGRGREGRSGRVLLSCIHRRTPHDDFGCGGSTGGAGDRSHQCVKR